MPEPIMAYAQLNARIMPMARGEQYEDPLSDALEENGLGEVTGSGTMQSKEGEIDYCGLDIDLFDEAKGAAFVCDFLTKCGAPKGSLLQYEVDGRKVELPFGAMEGLALYLNGTDLPAEVYKQCDVNLVFDRINQLLGDRGGIRGYWQGPTETAIYFYGPSAQQMEQAVTPFLAEYPLCQKSRLKRIA